MDDYNVNVLSEAKNEYSSRLLNIVTPLIILGIKSIFSEAVDLCSDNNEDEKYLMTFQNFLSRVPKWNANIVKEETTRIVSESKCPYLEDLLTCVHITQLKILTSIRVSSQQKKIEIDIPKLEDFIHKIYIQYARKLYTNIYLFEKDIMPLDYQKNMREAEIICRECVLKVIRDSMPIEQILRAYMDESVHDEIVEETLEKEVTEGESIDMLEEAKKNNEGNEIEINKIGSDAVITEPKLLTNSDIAAEAIKEVNDSIEADAAPIAPIAAPIAPIAPIAAPIAPIAPPTIAPIVAAPIASPIASPIAPIAPKSNITFDENDHILDMGTNKKTTVHAPKTDDRLDSISRIANAKRKAEDADDEEDFDDGPLKIGGSNITLDITDIQDISKDLKINTNPLLDDVEILM
jgi:hypothetical protein